MFRGIVESSLRFRYLVIAAAAAMMLFGVAQLRQMPVDALPEFAPPYVEVQTEALGLSASEVEMLVSLSLESLLHGLPWLQSIHSTSVPGLSSVVLVFEPGTDIIRVRQLVAERLTAAPHVLPNVSQPPVILQPLSATSRVMMVGLRARDVTPIEMSVLARWTIRPALLSVPGVANVAMWGQRERQLQVQVDPERLRAQGVTLDQVIRTTGDALWVSPLSFLNASTPGSGGWIDTPQQRLEVRHVLPISTPADLAQVSISGTPLRLGDVATVVEDHQPLIGDAIIGDGPGLLLVVEKFPGANTLEVTRGVEKALEALKPGLGGIEIDTTIFRSATFIEMSIDNLTKVLLLGALLMVVVLGLFLFEWRAALTALVAIPLSLAAAGLVLYLRGTTMNALVLAGFVVALGVVVDDAIIGVENVARRLREHRRAGSTVSAASVILDSSLEVRGAVVYATLIMVLVVLPVFFLEGVTAAFFQPLVVSYLLAVLASMLVALVVTPAVGLILMSGAPLERRESPLTGWLQRRHGGVLTRAGRTRVPAFVTVAVMAVMVLAGLAVLPTLGQQTLLPPFREPYLMIPWEGAPGTSHPAMTRLTKEVGDALRTIPGVRSFGGHVGRAVTGDQVVGINSGQLWVSIDPKADYGATVAAVQEVIAGYPGLARGVQTYLQDTLRQSLAGSSDAIVVRIYGPDLETLRGKAEEVRQALAGIDGVVDLRTELQIEEPNVQIEADLARAELHGLKPGDVRRAAATLLAGIHVNSLFEGQKVFDVVVWGAPETRESLSDIRELLIDTPGGGHVRLDEVADVSIAPTLNIINREGVSRRIDVSFNVRGRDLGAVVGDVERALQQIQFPLEYHPELLGEYTERQDALLRILLFAVAAAMGIFLLLHASFDSWRLALLSFLTLPAALAGGVLAVFATGGAISIGSLVGFLAVLGIVARNSIMLIKHYQYLEQEEGEPFGVDLVLRGTQERLAPILMTATTIGLALVPIALFGSLPGYEILHPMAVVILGGLVTSTLLSLFVMPALYLAVGQPSTSPAHLASLRYRGGLDAAPRD